MAGKDDIQAKGGATGDPGTTGKHFAAPGTQSTASIMAANAQNAASGVADSNSLEARRAAAAAEIDPALEARAMRGLAMLEEVEGYSSQELYYRKHRWPLRICGVISALSFLVSAAGIVLLTLGAALSIQEIAAELGVDTGVAAFQMFTMLGLAGLASFVDLLVSINAFRAVKNPAKAKTFTTLAEIMTAISGVNVVWNLAQGSVSGIEDIAGHLLSIAINFAFVWVGLQAMRTAEAGTTEAAQVAALRELMRERRKLGFMRFFQFVYGINVLGTVVILVFVTRDQMVLGLPEILNLVGLSFDCVCFYLLWKRLRVARPVITALSVAHILVRAVTLFVTGGEMGFSAMFVTLVAGSLFDLLAILYFGFSRRTREVLVEEISQRTNLDAVDENYIAKRGWPKWRNLILYYCVFSVLGHWMELAFCMLIRAGVVAGEYDPTNTMLWRDFLYPFPMEGMAVVLCALILYPLKNWLVSHIKVPVLPWVISFIVNALMCTGIELGGGLLFNPNHELWDYSNMFMNFMGQVCLQNAIGFGIACSLITWVVYPALERAIAQLPDDLMQIIFVGAMTFNIMLQALYIVEPEQLADGVSKLWGSFQGKEFDAQLPVAASTMIRMMLRR